jgi:hypothetical protein
VPLTTVVEPDAVHVRFRRCDGLTGTATLDRVSAADVLGWLPVREFRSWKGRRHYSGWYWSATSGGLVAYESRLELARILLADFDPEVTGIAAQPFELAGPDGGKIRQHVPDLLLSGAGGSVTVVDVKPAARMGEAAVAAQFGWAERVCAGRGWRFEAWSGADRILLENVPFLAGYRRAMVIDTTLVPVVLATAEREHAIGTIEREVARLHPAGMVRPVILHLLWRGLLRADLSLPLGPCTALEVLAGAPA